MKCDLDEVKVNRMNAPITSQSMELRDRFLGHVKMALDTVSIFVDSSPPSCERVKRRLSLLDSIRFCLLPCHMTNGLHVPGGRPLIDQFS